MVSDLSHTPCVNQLMLYSRNDIAKPIENEISNSQCCKATDMLHFLFSFCNTGGDAAQVKPKNKELEAAFKEVQQLANKKKTPLRINLKSV